MCCLPHAFRLEVCGARENSSLKYKFRNSWWSHWGLSAIFVTVQICSSSAALAWQCRCSHSLCVNRVSENKSVYKAYFLVAYSRISFLLNKICEHIQLQLSLIACLCFMLCSKSYNLNALNLRTIGDHKCFTHLGPILVLVPKNQQWGIWLAKQYWYNAESFFNMTLWLK